MRLLVALLCPLLVAVAAAPPVAAEGGYSPPVPAPVVDGWRPPPSLFSAGNRGVDFGAADGDPVAASAGGEVVFAGRVGLDHHVVVLHDDGIRTSYSFLREVAVRRGDRVERGERVGTAGGPVHFGARAGDRYIDPTLLLGGGDVDVRLVPVELRSPQSEAVERRGLLQGIVGAGRWAWQAGSAAVAWAREGTDQLADGVVAEIGRWRVIVDALGHFAALPVEAAEQLWRGVEYRRDQRDCTPTSVPAPRPPPGRRIAVLVAGFGSSSDDAAVLGLDTRSLGYADDDVARFSYRGGQAPDERRLAGVTTTTYSSDDARQGLDESAARLRGLLEEVRREHPGVPVDLIGHSQGGVVALRALQDADRLDPRMPPVEHVITLGSPHDGADLATAGAVLSRTLLGSPSLLAGAGSAAADDLSETSSFMRAYRDRPLPEGVRVTSVAAAGDLVVPATHSVLPGDAVHALVPVTGVGAHDHLPASADAHREVALALAGHGPTCRDTAAAVAGAVGISALEDLTGAALAAPAVWFERPSGVTRSPGQPRGR